jgi:hypothetical protein
MQIWETTFNQLMDALMPQLVEGEAITVGLVAEESEFTRFNHAKVRQTGSIENGSHVRDADGERAIGHRVHHLYRGKRGGLAAAHDALQTLRDELPQLPEDPYIVLPAGNDHSRDVYDGELLAMAAIAPITAQNGGARRRRPLCRGALCARLCRLRRATSLVCHRDLHPGLFPIHRVGPSCEGHLCRAAPGMTRPMPRTSPPPKPAGPNVSAAQKARARPVSHLLCARCRCRFDEYAVLGRHWGSLDSSRRQCPGAITAGRESTLSDKLHLAEDFSQGQVPRFNQYGELAPLTMPLIAGGQLQNTLVSARTAKEYGIPSTFAEGGEYLRSPTLAPGNWPKATFWQR